MAFDSIDFSTSSQTTQLGVHRPGEAAALVVERGAGLDRPLRLERADAELLGDRDLADRAGRADLAAQGAVQLAPAHLRDHDRGPEPLDAPLEEAAAGGRSSGRPGCTGRT